MIFSCGREAFALALKEAEAVINSKNSIVALTCVHLEANQDSSITIKAFDYVATYSRRISVDHVEIPGKVLVPVKDLRSRVNAIGGDRLTFSEKENQLEIRNNSKRRFVISCLDPATFPPLYEVNGTCLLKADALWLKSQMKKCTPSASNDDTRPHMAAVYFEAKTGPQIGSLQLAATDGHRCAVISGETEVISDVEFLIPIRSVYALDKILFSGVISIFVEERHVHFVCPDLTLSLSRADSQFPPYRDLIQSCELSAVVPRKPFAEAVKSLSVVTGDGKGVKLSFSTGTLKLTTEESNAGLGEDSVPITYDGPSKTVMFSPKYISDALIGASETIELQFSLDEMEPLYLLDEHERGSDLWIIMPMRML